MRRSMPATPSPVSLVPAAASSPAALPAGAGAASGSEAPPLLLGAAPEAAPALPACSACLQAHAGMRHEVAEVRAAAAHALVAMLVALPAYWLSLTHNEAREQMWPLRKQLAQQTLLHAHARSAHVQEKSRTGGRRIATGAPSSV